MPAPRRAPRPALPLALCAAALAAAPGCAPEEPVPPAAQDPVREDLDGDVEVWFDAYGIPHVRATTEHDACFAQGYVTARDRAFQMEWRRRTALGEKAEIAGEEELDSDIFLRGLAFGRLAEAVEARIRVEEPELYSCVDAYARGVNALFADAREGRNGLSLSPQFEAWGFEPRDWTARDVLAVEKAIAFSLSAHWDNDILVGLAKVLLAGTIFEDLVRYAPIEPSYTSPEFFQGVAARPAAPGRPAPGRAPRIEADRDTLLRALRGMQERAVTGAGRGSNNWVVSGAHTHSGHAMLASDAHQGVGDPTAFYEVHLTAGDPADPEIDVNGLSFAGAPYVAMGHNRHIAFAATVDYLDVGDVWVESFSGASVEWKGEWVPVEQTHEVFRVRPEGGLPADAVETTALAGWVPHHGPVLYADGMGLPADLPLTGGWVGFGSSTAMTPFRAIDRARGWEDFTAAMSTFVAGGVNIVYADVEGNIGWSTHADLPVREALDPSNPPWTMLDGSGGYDWTGESVPDAQVPWAFNPEWGFLATANADPVGTTDDNDPLDEPAYLGPLYDSGTRVGRISSLLADLVERGGITLDDLSGVQLDARSGHAPRLIPYLLDAAARRPDLLADPQVAAAVAAMEGWDLGCGLDAVGPTLFFAWMPHVARAALADDSLDDLYADVGDQLDVLIRPLIHFLDATAADIDGLDAGTVPFPSVSGRNYFDDLRTPEVETRDALLLGALATAVTDLRAVAPGVGADPDDLQTWTWGRFAQWWPSPEGGRFMPELQAGPYAIAGCPGAVHVAGVQYLRGGRVPEEGFRVHNAPSNQVLVELDPAGVVGWNVMPGGQSESPESPHYLDQVEGYLSGARRPMLFRAEDVEAGAVERWTFPAGFPTEGAVTAEVLP